MSCRDGFLFSIDDGDHVGWGEASPIPGWSVTGLGDTEWALRQAKSEITGGDEAVVGQVVGELAAEPHARAAVASAWADLQARTLGLSLAVYLMDSYLPSGEPPDLRVSVNAFIAALDIANVEAEAIVAARSGFRHVKLKVGSSQPIIDIHRVRAARAAIGPDVELRLDANGSWDHGTAADLLNEVAAQDIAFCEEPVEGIEAQAALADVVSIPVAADESVRTADDARRAVELGLPVLVVKPQALGGPDTTMQIVGLAQEAGAKVIVTSFLDSAVGLTHAAHVAGAVGPAEAHGLATAKIFTRDLAEPPPLEAGVMTLPEVPGLGITPDD